MSSADTTLDKIEALTARIDEEVALGGDIGYIARLREDVSDLFTQYSEQTKEE